MTAGLNRVLAGFRDFVLNNSKLSFRQSWFVVCVAIVGLFWIPTLGIIAVFLRPDKPGSGLYCLVANPHCSEAVATWVGAFFVSVFSLDRVLLARARATMDGSPAAYRRDSEQQESDTPKIAKRPAIAKGGPGDFTLSGNVGEAVVVRIERSHNNGP